MKPLRLFAGIFLCSLSAISFEITLTRVFSISLWYHFAFMVISIAMLGLSAAGTLLSLAQSVRKKGYLGAYAIGLSVSVLAGYIGTNLVTIDPARLAWDHRQLFSVGILYVLLAVPFFFFGLIVTTALATESERASAVYGADLLGAGAGSLAAIFLMSGSGPETSIPAIAVCALAGAAIFGRAGTAIIATAAAVLLIFAGTDLLDLRMSPYKGLEQALRFPGARLLSTHYSGFTRVDIFESPMARFAPGMSLKYLEPLPRQLGLAVDGDGINAITDIQGDRSFLGFLPSALPYEIAPRQRVLIADPGGGLHILLARHYKADHIEKAESNALIVDVMRSDQREFSGGIYDTGFYKAPARSRLLRTRGGFDVIDISLTNTVPLGHFGMTEAYGFTVEAFSQYLSDLSESGVICLSSYVIPPPRTELRLLATLIEALDGAGVSDPGSHVAAIRSWGTLTILAKRTAFTTEEVNAIIRFSKDRNFDLVHYPGIREDETNIYVQLPDNDYYRAFRALINKGTRPAFLRDYVFDVTPAHDDRPFFHYYLKQGRLKETIGVMGGKWQFLVEEGYLLPVVLAQVVVMSLFLLLLPALKRTGRLRPASFLVYFAFLGVGFMFVEVPLIQGMILPLENPAYAVAAVLASVLSWSGAGSLLSQRYPQMRTPRTVLAIAILIVPYGLALAAVSAKVAALPLALKFVLSFLLTAPAAILMGIPFPMGMLVLGRSDPGMIPWAWAVNGCFSVMAPVLAAMLALALGFKAVFLTGALMYAGAFAVIRKERTTSG